MLETPFSSTNKMALVNFLLVLILLPSLDALNAETYTPNNISTSDPTSDLSTALKLTLDEARRAIESLSKFTTLSISYREQVAIEDCKELLDFSVSELGWSLGEMKRIRQGMKNPHSEGNLKAWLSAALSNQDTCLEGFEGTDGKLERFVRGSLRQVS